MVERLPEMLGERDGLIFGQIEGHPGDVGRLTVAGKASAHFPSLISRLMWDRITSNWSALGNGVVAPL